MILNISYEYNYFITNKILLQSVNMNTNLYLY